MILIPVNNCLMTNLFWARLKSRKVILRKLKKMEKNLPADSGVDIRNEKEESEEDE